MGKMVVKTLSLAGLLVLVSVTLSQSQDESPKSAKLKKSDTSGGKASVATSGKAAAASLEERLAQAFQNNPDIRVAEAKVREAEAEMNRARMQIAQKVITLHHSLEGQKEVVKYAQTSYDRLKLVSNNLVSSQELEAAEATLAQAKGKLAALEAEMPSLLGKLPQAVMSYDQTFSSFLRSELLAAHQGVVGSVAFSPDGRLFSAMRDGSVRIWEADIGKQLTQAWAGGKTTPEKPRLGASMEEKIHKALDAPIRVDYKALAFQEVLKDLQQKSGMTIITKLDLDKRALVTLQLSEPVPLGAALQALEDSANLRIVVRDYGLFVGYANEPLPDRAVSLYEFWKGSASGDRTKPSGNAVKNPTRTGVEGVVQEVDPKGDVVKISIGHDAGLSKGQNLEVFRLKPEPKYLGTIELLEVSPNSSIAKPRSNSRGIQLGDRVTTHVREN